MSDREKVKALAAKMGCTIEVNKEGRMIDINIDFPSHKCFGEEQHGVHVAMYIEWTRKAWSEALEELQEVVLYDCAPTCSCFEETEELSEMRK